MKPVAIALRATVFVPQIIGYSVTNREKLMHLLENANVASLGPILGVSPNMPMNANIPDGSSWQLVSGDISIQFYLNKIDVIKTHPTLEVNEKAFREQAVNIFRGIMDVMEELKYVKRIAYAPVYAVDELDNGKKAEEFLQSLISIPTFGERKAQEIHLNVNYKGNYAIRGKEYETNFLLRIGEGSKQTPQNVVKCIILDFDLNTVGEEQRFEMADIEDFFTTIDESREKLINSILK